MITARRMGRWALYGLGGVLVLGIVLRVGMGLFLATSAGKGMVARMIETRIGMPVKVRSIRLGFATSSISMRVFDPAVADAAKAEVLSVDSATADVSLIDLLSGHVARSTVELRGVNLTLHVSADGDVITTLPKSSGGESFATPAFHLTGGQITIQQDGRPEFALHKLNLEVTPTPDGGANLSGSIDDPEWSHWTVAGQISGTTSSGSVELSTANGPLTMDRLGSIPFVPPSVWENVKPDGRGSIALRSLEEAGGRDSICG